MLSRLKLLKCYNCIKLTITKMKTQLTINIDSFLISMLRDKARHLDFETEDLSEVISELLNRYFDRE